MKFFEKIDLSKTLLPLSEFKLFCDMDPGTQIPEEKKNKILADAETMLSEPIPQLLASCYARFVRDGNRSEYEGYQFRRRIMLKTLTQAELIENQGRFLDKIIDLVWLIAEETTWVIPAHNYGLYDKPASNLLARDVEDQVHVIDLFSSETGAVMALTRYLLGEKLDAIYPKITRRMDYVIEKHILAPFERELFRWAGYGPNGFLNNWNPWVIANILMGIVGLLTAKTVARVALVPNSVLAVIIGLALWIGIRNSQSACDYYDYAVSEGSILPTEDIRWGPSAH